MGPAHLSLAELPQRHLLDVHIHLRHGRFKHILTEGKAGNEKKTFAEGPIAEQYAEAESQDNQLINQHVERGRDE